MGDTTRPRTSAWLAFSWPYAASMFGTTLVLCCLAALLFALAGANGAEWSAVIAVAVFGGLGLGVIMGALAALLSRPLGGSGAVKRISTLVGTTTLASLLLLWGSGVASGDQSPFAWAVIFTIPIAFLALCGAGAGELLLRATRSRR